MALDNEYKLLLASIKERVWEAQLKTVVAASSQLLYLYWQLGNFILQNQNKYGWGAKIIDSLSGDLSKEFPELKGFSVSNLKYMRKFAEAYPLVMIQAFSQLESEIKNEGGFTQQSVNKLLSIDNQTNIFVQQPVAQFAKPLTANVQQPVAQTEETLFLG